MMKNYIILHTIIFLYALSNLFSKLAANTEWSSISFLLYYSGALALLAVYAVAWQQIIKRLPLSVAFANKAVNIIWSLILGTIIFHEDITASKIAGAGLVMFGIYLYSGGEDHSAE